MRRNVVFGFVLIGEILCTILLSTGIWSCSKNEGPTEPVSTGTITGVITNWAVEGLPEIRIDGDIVSPEWNEGRYTISGVGPGLRLIDIWKYKYFTAVYDTVWVNAGQTYDLGTARLRDIFIDTVPDYAYVLNPYSVIQRTNSMSNGCLIGMGPSESGYLIADMGEDEWLVAGDLSQEDFLVITFPETDAAFTINVSSDGVDFVRIARQRRVDRENLHTLWYCNIDGTGLDSARYVKIEHTDPWPFSSVVLGNIVASDRIHPMGW